MAKQTSKPISEEMVEQSITVDPTEEQEAYGVESTKGESVQGEAGYTAQRVAGPFAGVAKASATLWGRTPTTGAYPPKGLHATFSTTGSEGLEQITQWVPEEVLVYRDPGTFLVPVQSTADYARMTFAAALSRPGVNFYRVLAGVQGGLLALAHAQGAFVQKDASWRSSTDAVNKRGLTWSEGILVFGQVVDRFFAEQDSQALSQVISGSDADKAAIVEVIKAILVAAASSVEMVEPMPSFWWRWNVPKAPDAEELPLLAGRAQVLAAPFDSWLPRAPSTLKVPLGDFLTGLQGTAMQMKALTAQVKAVTSTLDESLRYLHSALTRVDTPLLNEFAPLTRLANVSVLVLSEPSPHPYPMGEAHMLAQRVGDAVNVLMSHPFVKTVPTRVYAGGAAITRFLDPVNAEPRITLVHHRLEEQGTTALVYDTDLETRQVRVLESALDSDPFHRTTPLIDEVLQAAVGWSWDRLAATAQVRDSGSLLMSPMSLEELSLLAICLVDWLVVERSEDDGRAVIRTRARFSWDAAQRPELFNSLRQDTECSGGDGASAWGLTTRWDSVLMYARLPTPSTEQHEGDGLAGLLATRERLRYVAADSKKTATKALPTELRKLVLRAVTVERDAKTGIRTINEVSVPAPEERLETLLRLRPDYPVSVMLPDGLRRSAVENLRLLTGLVGLLHGSLSLSDDINRAVFDKELGIWTIGSLSAASDAEGLRDAQTVARLGLHASIKMSRLRQINRLTDELLALNGRARPRPGRPLANLAIAHNAVTSFLVLATHFLSLTAKQRSVLQEILEGPATRALVADAEEWGDR